MMAIAMEMLEFRSTAEDCSRWRDRGAGRRPVCLLVAPFHRLLARAEYLAEQATCANAAPMADSSSCRRTTCRTLRVARSTCAAAPAATCGRSADRRRVLSRDGAAGIAACVRARACGRRIVRRSLVAVEAVIASYVKTAPRMRAASLRTPATGIPASRSPKCAITGHCGRSPAASSMPPP